ncbi:MAG: tetratricopeptide repeat protein [Syntrophorhabdaceae bacterium]|nr:tetratricopeptide repeat protein [Syntrophorhabdaceae bacterium]
MGKGRTVILCGAAICLLVAGTWFLSHFVYSSEIKPQPASPSFAGSGSCRECHARFYQLWSTSFHGLAMQPYTAPFARAKLTAQTDDVIIGRYRYRADISEDAGWVTESGPEGKKRYGIEHVLGGKNVYYFLTPLEKGRLQTLPVAYDVRKKEWFDTAASGIRHIPGRRPDDPVNWKDRPYTFNTACYNCHVSQLSTNYDAKTDVYHTTWREPGINCETCHGPAEEHNRLFRTTPKGQRPKDMKIISVGSFTPEQHNATCSVCHAKTMPLTSSFKPGDRFFDHFDLVTLEDPDFYPDGRDLGENYTYTGWRMSPCARSGKLHCVSCHTSSGRYRFKAEEKANDACLPCHEERVKNAPAHTRHKADSKGNRCVSCHMPATDFARMIRSDHSMLPPTPLATIRFKSPNACNICHSGQDAQWADTWVRKWRTRDYQAPIIYRAGLIDAARRRDWSRLPQMLSYLTQNDRDEVFAVSLIRLLRACGDEKKWPVILKMTGDPSPLVRAAAAESLSGFPSRESIKALVAATGDAYRLVRIRSATALSYLPRMRFGEGDAKKIKAATEEYLASIRTYPDQWNSHYNLGNYYLNQGNLSSAVSAYEKALAFEPGAILPLINMSIAYARTGDNAKAEEALGKALDREPSNAEANFNMGLIKAEKDDYAGAEKYFLAALRSDPQMPQAAYNLCVILSKGRLHEALPYCQKAVEILPYEPRYAYTLAFYKNRQGDTAGATKILQDTIKQQPFYGDAYILLGEIYEKQGKVSDAKTLYLEGLTKNAIPSSYRQRFSERLKALTPPDKPGKQ